MLLSYAGHVLRADGSLEKDILTGRMDGSRRKGRPRINYWDKLKELSGLRPDKIADVARDGGALSSTSPEVDLDLTAPGDQVTSLTSLPTPLLPTLLTSLPTPLLCYMYVTNQSSNTVIMLVHDSFKGILFLKCVYEVNRHLLSPTSYGSTTSSLVADHSSLGVCK